MAKHRSEIMRRADDFLGHVVGGTLSKSENWIPAKHHTRAGMKTLMRDAITESSVLKTLTIMCICVYVYVYVYIRGDSDNDKRKLHFGTLAVLVVGILGGPGRHARRHGVFRGWESNNDNARFYQMGKMGMRGKSNTSCAIIRSCDLAFLGRSDSWLVKTMETWCSALILR